MTTIKHPIHAHFARKGTSLDELKSLSTLFKADYVGIEADKIVITCRTGVQPRVLVGPTDYLLGEIGLQYITYRLKNYIDPKDAMRLFRKGFYEELTKNLSYGLNRLIEREGLKRYVAVSVDGELVALLTQYTPVRNGTVIKEIEDSSLSERLEKWVFKPLEMNLYLLSGERSKVFGYGVRIRNGETGHVALSFHSALWCDSIIGPNGHTYTITSPLMLQGYAKHMSGKKLATALMNLKKAMKENKYAEAIEKARKIPGEWAAGAFSGFWPEIKGREVSLMRTQAIVEDHLLIAAGGSAIDVIIAALEVGASESKSAMGICEQLVSKLLDKIFLLEDKKAWRKKK